MVLAFYDLQIVPILLVPMMFMSRQLKFDDSALDQVHEVLIEGLRSVLFSSFLDQIDDLLHALRVGNTISNRSRDEHNLDSHHAPTFLHR